ncbi:MULTISPECIES: hypothetical protein [Streptomyces]
MVVQQGGVNVLPPFLTGRVFLYDADNNRPLPGRSVIFTNSGGSEICRAVTDSNGEAGCTGPVALGPTAVDSVYNGYFASFAGDEHYKPVKAHGAVNVFVDPLY